MGYTAAETRYDTMQYHRTGKSGLLLPVLSLGFWHNFGTQGQLRQHEADVLYSI